MEVNVVVKIEETVDVESMDLSNEKEKLNCAKEAFLALLDTYPQLSEFECELMLVYNTNTLQTIYKDKEE